MVRMLATVDGLDLDLIADDGSDSGLTVVAEDQGRERSFLSSLGAMGHFSPADVPADALTAQYVLCSGYFLLPGMRGEATGSLLSDARQQGATTDRKSGGQGKRGQPGTAWMLQ